MDADAMMVYFINGPYEGKTQLVRNPGRDIVVDVIPPVSSRVVSANPPLRNYDDVMKGIRYTYVPVSRYMSLDGVLTWDYACRELPLPSSPYPLQGETILFKGIFEKTLEIAKEKVNQDVRQRTKRKYKVVRRPKLEAR